MVRISQFARWGFAVSLTLVFSVSVVTPVTRGDDTSNAEIADLHKQIDELRATVHDMQDHRFATSTDAATPPTPAAGDADPSGAIPTAVPNVGDGGASNVSSSVPPRPTERVGSHTGGFPLAGWNEGFYLRSDDKSYELHITGQLQADYRGFLDTVDTGTSPDTFLIRRARLGIEATVLKYYEFRLLPDFAGTSLSKSITDAYVNVHYWDALQVEMGKFKQPFSYEQLIQDRYVPFLERSMIDQLVPQRDEGVMVHGRKLFEDRLDYAVAISNGDQNDSTVDSNNSKDFNSRIAVRPLNDPEFAFLRHLQVGISYGVGTEKQAISPTVLTTPATVEWFTYNTGVLANGERSRISPELAFFYGSFGFSAQYYREEQRVQALATRPIVDVQTDGYYFMATYLLTGEERYDYTQQIDPIHPFVATSPMCDPGAWELTGRISKLDLDPSVFSANLATPGQSSSGATECTLGFNWYLNKWVRGQFNWEHSWFNDPVKIGTEVVPVTHCDALYTRFQFIF